SQRGTFPGTDDIQRACEDRILPRPERDGDIDRDVRLDTDAVASVTVTCEPFRDRETECAALAGELLPLLDGPLAERPLPDERSPAGVVQRSRYGLTGGRTATVDEDHAPDRGIRRRPVGDRVGLDVGAVRVLLEEDRARADELARDGAGGGDIATRIAAEVDDEHPAARIDVPLHRGGEVRCGPIREAFETHIADAAVHQLARLDLLLLDDVAHDLELEGARRSALDRELDRRVLPPAPPLASARAPQSAQRHAIGHEHEAPRGT